MPSQLHASVATTVYIKMTLDWILPIGPFTNYVDKQGRGVAKCQRYYKSLYCKLSSQQGEKGSANEVCG